MERLVFSELMRREIIQKSIIFASAFGLKVDEWKPANNEEFPYRIIFFNEGKVVGYVEALPYGFGTSSIRQEMPFSLFTPCGEVSGYFYSYKQIFNYNLNLESNDQLHGLFEVKSENENGVKKYKARSHISLSTENKKLKISFNELNSNYIVGISSENENGQEAINLFLSDDKQSPIILRKFSRRDDKGVFTETLSKILIDLVSESTDKVPVKFSFSQIPAYLKEIDLKKRFDDADLAHSKITQVDLQPIEYEIAENDPSFISLIEEVRRSLSIPIDDDRSVSIYDRLASLCFPEDCEKLFLDFTRINGTKSDFKRKNTTHK